MEETTICDYCEKDFNTKTKLLRHLCFNNICLSGEGHNSEVHPCMWCLCVFDSEIELRQHYKECKSDKEFLYKKSLNFIDYYKEEINNLIEKLKDSDEENKKLKKELYDIILDKTSLSN